MSDSEPQTASGCSRCRDLPSLPFDFTMAFQPIVDIGTREVFAYEALVRGVNGEGAYDILNQVTDDNRYQFDQACRVKAIELAARLNIRCGLSINFLPNAVYEPKSCIKATLDAAERYQFPCDRIIFEVNESEPVGDAGHLERIFKEYHAQGFTTAIDDFGAGHAGLNLLADFQPGIIKLDMALIRNIDSNKIRQSIVRGVCNTCDEFGIKVIAEGVETVGELAALRGIGIRFFQGYLLARPAVEQLPEVNYPALDAN
ncbi:EAL domain-containing protein [Marinimicrobium agarilyticum]|uniref:EAL domain-containing protein n=1 Tax=Marinimicrobium agarilyticum TaxID=306546 RepID=UPI0004879BB9|nr:EAL domain-containing protein [Marinimicrobium agarilyticum]